MAERGFVAMNGDGSGRFESTDGERWATVKERDNFDGHHRSWHVVFSDGRQMGGEFRWPWLFNFCARWVTEGR